MKIKQNFVEQSKYNIKCPYDMTAQFIVVHNTANDASAENEIAYMRRNNEQLSFHFAVDDKEIIQGIPLNRNAWHAGDGKDGKGNRHGIAIEICYSESGGDRFISAEKLATKLIVQLLHERGWGIDKVTKHQDYSGKYCPHRTLDMGWQRFLDMIQAELNATGATPQPVPEPGNNTGIKVGDRVRVNRGAKSYTGGGIAAFVYDNVYTVDEIKGDRAVLDKNGICSPFNVVDLTVVNAVENPAPRPEPEKPANKVITVKPGTWNVRTAPSMSASIARVVKGGQQYTCYSINADGWAQIDGGYIGPKGYTK